jgi:putative SOS response-associated peptidase YedK
MCGRYASSRSPETLVEIFEIEEDDVTAAATGSAAAAGAPGEAGPDGAAQEQGPAGPTAVTKYNIAPTNTVPVVVERMRADEPAEGDLEAERELAEGTPVKEHAVRQLRPLTWGLVPSWSKDRKSGARMINARVESLLEKPAFKRAALTRRCLVPADGWYEWQASPSVKDAKGKPRKQPFFMQLADRDDQEGVLAFGGIYEFWRDKDLHPDDPQAWLVTFSIITTAAEPGLDVIHDRMPLVLPPDRWPAWLDPARRDPDDVRAILESIPEGRFTAVPITTRVNSVRNDGPELLEPAPMDSLVGVVDPGTGELIGGDAEPLF